ncbi:MAG: VanZ family protein [Clostridia bacterium]|nr:VanZ family protein [Clostridia bacterium]
MKRIIIIILLWALVFSCMVLIFTMSSEPAVVSSETSGNTLRAILKIVYPGFRDLEESEQQPIIDKYQHFIRKTAHFTVYTLLGILVSLAMAQHTKSFLLPSYLIGTLYAVSDEIHQLYVPGRSGQISDVLLDSAGVLLGCLLIFILYKLIKKKRAN